MSEYSPLLPLCLYSLVSLLEIVVGTLESDQLSSGLNLTGHEICEIDGATEGSQSIMQKARGGAWLKWEGSDVFAQNLDVSSSLVASRKLAGNLFTWMVYE